MAQVTKEMTLTDVLDLDRGTVAIFMQAGMHCLGCAMASMENIEQACTVHGIDPDELVDALNEYLQDK